MNTYRDDPTKGLSELQKKILAWIAKPSRFASPDEPAPIGKPLDERPTFDYTTSRWGYTRSNSAAFSRALANLEMRGLLCKVTNHGKTIWIELTKAGRDYVKQLS